MIVWVTLVTLPFLVRFTKIFTASEMGCQSAIIWKCTFPIFVSTHASEHIDYAVNMVSLCNEGDQIWENGVDRGLVHTISRVLH